MLLHLTISILKNPNWTPHQQNVLLALDQPIFDFSGYGSLFIAGQEFSVQKMIENTYNVSDTINRLDWDYNILIYSGIN